MLRHRKALARLARITASYWLKKETRVSYPPYRLWIEPTNRCNLACVMCPNKELPSDTLGNMDFDLFTSLIDQIGPDVHDVNLHHRGEPTLHPKLAEMIRYADQRGVKVKLHTNGTTLTEKLSEALILSGLRLISFSFDGYTAEAYESVRIGADFRKTLGNIHRFLEMKRTLGCDEPRTVMEVMELDDRPLAPEAKKVFIRSLKDRGLDRLIVKRPHNWAGSVLSHEMETSTFSACTFPWHALVVLWDGRVGSCPHDFFAEIVYGDARETSLAELFNSDRIYLLREQMTAGSADTLGSPCRACDSIRRKRIAGIPLASLKYLRN